MACRVCGATVEAKSPKRLYCSRRCSDVSRGHVLADRLTPKRCELPECGELFAPNKGDQRCCSERHGKMLWNRESRADGRQPNPPWSDKRRDSWHRRRAVIKGSPQGEPVLLSEIAQRDGWRCGICHRRVEAKAVYPDPGSASLDHILPLSRGGTHEPSNVQLAHLRCNVAKGNQADGASIPLFA